MSRSRTMRHHHIPGVPALVHNGDVEMLYFELNVGDHICQLRAPIGLARIIGINADWLLVFADAVDPVRRHGDSDA